MRSRAPLLVLIVVVSMAGACGGGGGTNEPTPVPRSQETWAARADAICARADRQVNALANPTTAGELVIFSSGLVSILDTTERDLRALGPPPGGAAEFNEMLAYYRQTRSSFEQTIERVRRLDPDMPADAIADPEIGDSFDAGLKANYQAAVVALRLGSSKCGANAVTTVALEEVDGSGQTGEAEISPISSDQLQVVLTLTNAPAEAQTADIFVGKCESLVAAIIEYHLQDVVGGRSKSTVKTSFEELTASLHHYSIVVSDVRTRSPVACGTLPVP